MKLEELDLDIKIEVTSIDELREIRKELQKIAKSKKEIEVTEDENDDPLSPSDFPDPKPDRDPDPIFPDYPKRDFPHFIMDTDTNNASFEAEVNTTFEEVANLADDISTNDGMSDETFHKVGNMEEDLFNDRQMR